MVTLLKEVRY